MSVLNLAALSSEVSQVNLTEKQLQVLDYMGVGTPIYVVLAVEKCINNLIDAGTTSLELPEPSYRFTRCSFREIPYYPRDLTYQIVKSLTGDLESNRAASWIVANNKGYDFAKCLKHFISEAASNL